jgi:Polyketide cyclase / dehydrase and lipid transport
VGTMLQRAFVVNAPLPVVWDHLSRVEAWPSWAGHIRRVHLDPPGGLTARSRGRFRLRGGVRSTFVMTAFDPPSSWTWAGRFLWLTVNYDHRFEALGERQTRLVWTVAAEGRGVAFLGRLFAAGYARNLDRAIPNLQRELDTYGRSA